MRILNIYRSTISDGPGLRYSIYLAGCNHTCPGCHNPSSWDPNAGMEVTESMIERIIYEIKSDYLLDGITISGGDPFYNPMELTSFLKLLKEETHMNIWCYTGYTIEQIRGSELLSKPLPYIDTLVEGPFVKKLFDPTLSWRGSSNQRIIDLHQNDADE